MWHITEDYIAACRTPRKRRRQRMGWVAVVAIALACASTLAIAGDADVIAAKAMRAPDNTWTFEVTIRSNDKGPDYYCDRFEILAPTGNILGVRDLAHPHADEQPFTRELSGVKISPGLVNGVLVRAHHSMRGYDGATVKVKLTK